ncbi:MAG: hypothetical protein FWF10_01775 [Clostridiales bacterium]|nr:hypothetical protein [Clostridiales bacterium]
MNNPRFEELLREGAAPHALLLAGMQGCGQNALARRFAALYLGLPESGLANSPYFYMCTETVVDAVRDAAFFVNRQAYGAGRRCVIFPDAHNLQPLAQNALLKTLEEPPANTLMILTGHEPGLLSTIRSRCAALRVGAEDANSFQTRLLREGIAPERAAICAALSGGAYDSAKEYATEQYWDFRRGVLDLIERLLHGKPVLLELHKYLAEQQPRPSVNSEKKKAGVQRESIAAFLELLLSVLRDIRMLRLDIRLPIIHADRADSLGKHAALFTNSALQGMMRVGFDAQKFLRDNASPPLLLDWSWAEMQQYINKDT